MQRAVVDSEHEPPVDILLVDDRPDNLTALVGMLERPGYRLVTANSGPEALKLLIRKSFALILLDVIMPTMDGFECASLIKGRERSRDVPIIFLTGAGIEPEKLRQAYALGAVDYLTKPLVPEVARAKVAFFVELHRKKEETRRQAEALRDAERRERDRQIAELQARADRRYRDLAEAIPQIVYRAAPDGAVTYLTRRWHEYTGIEPEAAEGWAWLEAVHPDDREALRLRWVQAAATGASLQIECRILGVRAGAYEWHLCQAVPEIGPAGNVVGWLGAYTNIQVQKRADEERTRLLAIAQEARAEAERNQRRVAILARVSAILGESLELEAPLQRTAEQLAQSLADGCIIEITTDVESEVRVVAHRDAAIERRMRERWPRWPLLSSGQRWIGPVRELSAGADPLARERGAPSADAEGAERVGIAAIEARGRRLGTVALFECAAMGESGLDSAFIADLASRLGTFVENVHLYERAQGAIAARDDFLAVASHELRTPFTSLQLQAEMLVRNLASDTLSAERADRALGVILRQVRRLSFMIDQLLDVSRIAAKRLVLETEEVDLRAIVNDVVERFQEELRTTETTARVAPGEPIIGVWDPSRLDQIVSNLVSNAIKYGKGSPIEIAFDPGERNAAITVIDQGIGIASEDIKRIFERFERAVPPGVYGGLGLGLYITRQLVLAHGGTIEIQSDPGKGTRVRVVLPRSQPQAAARGETEPGAHGSQESDRVAPGIAS